MALIDGDELTDADELIDGDDLTDGDEMDLDRLMDELTDGRVDLWTS